MNTTNIITYRNFNSDSRQSFLYDNDNNNAPTAEVQNIKKEVNSFFSQAIFANAAYSLYIANSATIQYPKINGQVKEIKRLYHTIVSDLLSINHKNAEESKKAVRNYNELLTIKNEKSASIDAISVKANPKEITKSMAKLIKKVKALSAVTEEVLTKMDEQEETDNEHLKKTNKQRDTVQRKTTFLASKTNALEDDLKEKEKRKQEMQEKAYTEGLFSFWTATFNAFIPDEVNIGCIGFSKTGKNDNNSETKPKILFKKNGDRIEKLSNKYQATSDSYRKQVNEMERETDEFRKELREKNAELASLLLEIQQLHRENNHLECAIRCMRTARMSFDIVLMMFENIKNSLKVIRMKFEELEEDAHEALGETIMLAWKHFGFLNKEMGKLIEEVKVYIERLATNAPIKDQDAWELTKKGSQYISDSSFSRHLPPGFVLRPQITWEDQNNVS